MLRIEDYTARINELYAEGKSAFDIYKALELKYPQPIYNYFKKMGWERIGRENYNYKRKYTVNLDFFKSINTEEKSYILGFICADGHVDLQRKSIGIALQDSDFKLLEKIRKCMNSSHPIIRHIKSKNPYLKSCNTELEKCSLNIPGKKLIEPLIKMGIAGNKTYTLNDAIMNYIPEKLIRHFLRGYFDGDGNITWGKHYSSGNKYLIQVAGNKEFLEGSFQKYFPSNCKLYYYKKSKQCYAWKLSDKRKVLEFLNYIYKDANIYLDRKFKIYQYAMWSYKTELIAGNSYFINLIKGQSAANLWVKCLEQVQRLVDETIKNPYEERNIEYNSTTNAQQSDSSVISD